MVSNWQDVDWDRDDDFVADLPRGRCTLDTVTMRVALTSFEQEADSISLAGES